MNFLKQKLQWIFTNLRHVAASNNAQEFNLVMGMLSAFTFAILEFFSFFLVKSNELAFHGIFLITSGVLFLLAILQLLAVLKKIPSELWITKVLAEVYPYLVVATGVSITWMYLGYSNQYESFMISMIAASVVHIFPAKQRMLFFSFSILAFNLIVYLYHGWSPIYFHALRISLLAGVIGFVYTYLHYAIFLQQRAMIDQIASKSHDQASIIDELKTAYNMLHRSNMVTESLMKVTTEILKTERLDDVLHLVLEEAMKLVPKAQAGSILVYNGKEMEYRAAVGYNLAKLKMITLHVEELFQSSLEDKYEPTIIRNLETFDTVSFGEEKFGQFREVVAKVAKSCLTCSFKYDGEFFGSMNLDNFVSEDIFTEDDKDLVRQFVKEVEITIAIHKLYEKSIRPSQFDELTGVFTRRHFKESLIAAFENRKRSATLSVIDIDHLKTINDTYGHDIGDAYIRHFVDAIVAASPKDVIIGRIGGDEFSVLLPEVDLAETELFFDGIRDTLEKNKFRQGKQWIPVTFSVGSASFPEEGTGIEELFRIADRRMYQNKNTTRP
ncbi:MAG: sensor domain-containing diguanylate cyclase [Candidatus Izemoplasmatales bacterium]|nr:sensor domain-containing diguanylate cyclase [Candidatus Izemoplasmatales bacterium]